jgi:hypothetical protein
MCRSGWLQDPATSVLGKNFITHLAQLNKEKYLIMPVNVDEKIRTLSPAQRQTVEAQAEELLAEEIILRAFPKARMLTQVHIAKVLEFTQDSVSRLEKRSDLLLSTLRKTVEAISEKLLLVAESPDRPPRVLSGIAEDDPAPKLGQREGT